MLARAFSREDALFALRGACYLHTALLANQRCTLYKRVPLFPFLPLAVLLMQGGNVRHPLWQWHRRAGLADGCIGTVRRDRAQGLILLFRIREAGAGAAPGAWHSCCFMAACRAGAGPALTHPSCSPACCVSVCRAARTCSQKYARARTCSRGCARLSAPSWRQQRVCRMGMGSRMTMACHLPMRMAMAPLLPISSGT